MLNLVIGSIITGKVIKRFSDHPAYLVWILDTSLYATLPKESSLKDFKIGETILGAIKEIKGARIILSQRIPQFTRRVFELELKDFILQHGWEIKRACIRANLGKVLIKTPQELCFAELNKMFSNKKTESKILKDYYDAINLVLIPKVSDPIRQVIEALRPAPVEQIKEVQIFSGKTSVYVPENLVGVFIGRKGANITTAKNILGKEIEIIASK